MGTDTLHLSALMAYGWSGFRGRPPGNDSSYRPQRSPDRGSSDAPRDLISAVFWAPQGPGCANGVQGDLSVVVAHASSSDGRCSPSCVLAESTTHRGGCVQTDCTNNREPIAHVILGHEGPIELLRRLIHRMLGRGDTP